MEENTNEGAEPISLLNEETEGSYSISKGREVVGIHDPDSGAYSYRKMSYSLTRAGELSPALFVATDDDKAYLYGVRPLEGEELGRGEGAVLLAVAATEESCFEEMSLYAARNIGDRIVLTFAKTVAGKEDYDNFWTVSTALLENQEGTGTLTSADWKPSPGEIIVKKGAVVVVFDPVNREGSTVEAHIESGKGNFIAVSVGVADEEMANNNPDAIVVSDALLKENDIEVKKSKEGEGRFKRLRGRAARKGKAMVLSEDTSADSPDGELFKHQTITVTPIAVNLRTMQISHPGSPRAAKTFLQLIESLKPSTKNGRYSIEGTLVIL